MAALVQDRAMAEASGRTTREATDLYEVRGARADRGCDGLRSRRAASWMRAAVLVGSIPVAVRAVPFAREAARGGRSGGAVGHKGDVTGVILTVSRAGGGTPEVWGLQPLDRRPNHACCGAGFGKLFFGEPWVVAVRSRNRLLSSKRGATRPADRSARIRTRVLPRPPMKSPSRPVSSLRRNG